MKCQEIERIVLSTEETRWTAEIRTHIARCPECGRLHQRTVFTRNLIALKRYEVPDPEAQARCVDQVHRQIERLRRPETGLSPSLFILPAPIYGIAAVCLILLGLHLAPSGDPGPLDTVVTDTSSRTFEQFVTEGLRSGWKPYFVTMPTDELTIPANYNSVIGQRPNSVFATNTPHLSQ